MGCYTAAAAVNALYNIPGESHITKVKELKQDMGIRKRDQVYHNLAG